MLAAPVGPASAQHLRHPHPEHAHAHASTCTRAPAGVQSRSRPTQHKICCSQIAAAPSKPRRAGQARKLGDRAGTGRQLHAAALATQAATRAHSQPAMPCCEGKGQRLWEVGARACVSARPPALLQVKVCPKEACHCQSAGTLARAPARDGRAAVAKERGPAQPRCRPPKGRPGAAVGHQSAREVVRGCALAAAAPAVLAHGAQHCRRGRRARGRGAEGAGCDGSCAASYSNGQLHGSPSPSQTHAPRQAGRQAALLLLPAAAAGRSWPAGPPPHQPKQWGSATAAPCGGHKADSQGKGHSTHR